MDSRQAVLTTPLLEKKLAAAKITSMIGKLKQGKSEVDVEVSKNKDQLKLKIKYTTVSM